MDKKDYEMVLRKYGDRKKPVYVLLYHPWMAGFEDYFPAHLSWLRRNGFESISTEELAGYLKGDQALIPGRPIVITLDDGTVEDYTIAYPALKGFGFTGTVFAPTAEKYLMLSGTDWWNEVESAGVLRIEGHSHSHALAFISDRVEGFFVDEKEERKPIIKGLEVRAGAPLFELGYELVSKRFIPSRKFVEKCVDYVKRQGDKAFFEKRGWKEELLGVAAEYRGDLGRYETEEEKRERIAEELEQSKKIIEETLGDGKEVRFFAYPFGAYDAGLVEQVKKAGYQGAFSTDAGGNGPGDDPFLIKRVTVSEENPSGGLGNILKEYE